MYLAFVALCSRLFKAPKLSALLFCTQCPIEDSHNTWWNLVAEIESFMLLFQAIFHLAFHAFVIMYTTLWWSFEPCGFNISRCLHVCILPQQASICWSFIMTRKMWNTGFIRCSWKDRKQSSEELPLNHCWSLLPAFIRKYCLELSDNVVLVPFLLFLFSSFNAAAPVQCCRNCITPTLEKKANGKKDFFLFLMSTTEVVRLNFSPLLLRDEDS